MGSDRCDGARAGAGTSTAVPGDVFPPPWAAWSSPEERSTAEIQRGFSLAIHPP